MFKVQLVMRAQTGETHRLRSVLRGLECTVEPLAAGFEVDLAGLGEKLDWGPAHLRAISTGILAIRVPARWAFDALRD
jgi:hypothetical protein